MANNSTTILFMLKSPVGEIVKGQAIIKDGLMFSTFGDPNLAEQLYNYDISRGEEVKFNKKHNAYVKKYNGLKRIEIVKKFKRELIKAGGKLVK